MANFKSTQNKQTFDYNPADKSFKVAKGEANKIVPIQTEKSFNQRMIDFSGDRNRSGGGAARTIKK